MGGSDGAPRCGPPPPSFPPRPPCTPTVAWHAPLPREPAGGGPAAVATGPTPTTPARCFEHSRGWNNQHTKFEITRSCVRRYTVLIDRLGAAAAAAAGGGLQFAAALPPGARATTPSSSAAQLTRPGLPPAPPARADIDESTKAELKDTLMAYDRTLLAVDPRHRESKKFGGPGAVRAAMQGLCTGSACMCRGASRHPSQALTPARACLCPSPPPPIRVATPCSARATRSRTVKRRSPRGHGSPVAAHTTQGVEGVRPCLGCGASGGARWRAAAQRDVDSDGVFASHVCLLPSASRPRWKRTLASRGHRSRLES